MITRSLEVFGPIVPEPTEEKLTTQNYIYIYYFYNIEAFRCNTLLTKKESTKLHCKNQ